MVAAWSPLISVGCDDPTRAFVARMYEQIQRSLTFRGADAITDHGAENVAIAETPMLGIFLRFFPRSMLANFGSTLWMSSQLYELSVVVFSL